MAILQHQHQQPPQLLANRSDGGEVDRQHHWENHSPDQHCDRQIDPRSLQGRNACRRIREPSAKADTNHDRQANPDGEIALEQTD